MEMNRDQKKDEVVDDSTLKMVIPIEADEMRFPLGATVITRIASGALHPDDIIVALGKHLRGDWGDVCKEDWWRNDQSLKEGSRLISSFKDRSGTKFWIITEQDRSMTTILLPEEY